MTKWFMGLLGQKTRRKDPHLVINVSLKCSINASLQVSQDYSF